MTDSRGYIGTKKDAQPDAHYTLGEIDSDAAPFSPAQIAYLNQRLAALTLNDLADVTIADPQTNDVLTYDADWSNG